MTAKSLSILDQGLQDLDQHLADSAIIVLAKRAVARRQEFIDHCIEQAKLQVVQVVRKETLANDLQQEQMLKVRAERRLLDIQAEREEVKLKLDKLQLEKDQAFWDARKPIETENAKAAARLNLTRTNRERRQPPPPPPEPVNLLRDAAISILNPLEEDDDE